MFQIDSLYGTISINIFLDPSGNPVTEQLQSVVVTDASGNPVTGMCKYNYTKSN